MAEIAPTVQKSWAEIQSKMGEKPNAPREVKKQLGKDDFMRIFVTQMKNQDPTKPFDAEKMATEMAQVTSVEQLQNMNQTLTKMTNQNQPLERMAMTNMIGKTVSVDRNRFQHAEGEGDNLSFKLKNDAKKCTLQVISMTGEVVFAKEMGEQKAGEVNFYWDGKAKTSLPAKSGQYLIRVEGETAEGKPVDTEKVARKDVVGVSFDGPEAVLLIGNPKSPEKVSLVQVARVEVGSGQSTSGNSIANSQPQQNQIQAGADKNDNVAEREALLGNMVMFEKGTGQKKLAVDQLDENQRKFLESTLLKAQAEAKTAALPKDKVGEGDLPKRKEFKELAN